METDQFDALTRQLSAADSSRRQAMRALASVLIGSTLGGMVARLGLGDVAEAKPKKRKAKPKPKRTTQADRKAHGQLQAEGKRKGKKRKNKPKPPPLPPECRDCNDCQMCQDGACVPDPALEGVRCLGSRATCGYCQSGQCVASDVPPCPDGVCPQRGQCCPGEKRCPDPESPTGFACIDPDACCPGEKRCGDRCVHRLVCCEEDRPPCGPCEEAFCRVNGTWGCSGKDCGGGVCVPEGQCCPHEWQCADGSCVAQDECCPNERECPDGACVSAGACCANEKLCPDGECIPHLQCCPNEEPPVCGECEVAACQGTWSCQPQSGCCPAGAVICSGVPYHYWPHLGRTLPAGCCPSDKMIEGPACAQPWSGGSAWSCD